jgi:molybdopterin/thiamine biosynthesis adenylyltransferase
VEENFSWDDEDDDPAPDPQHHEIVTEQLEVDNVTPNNYESGSVEEEEDVWGMEEARDSPKL